MSTPLTTARPPSTITTLSTWRTIFLLVGATCESDVITSLAVGIRARVANHGLMRTVNFHSSFTIQYHDRFFRKRYASVESLSDFRTSRQGDVASRRVIDSLACPTD